MAAAVVTSAIATSNAIPRLPHGMTPYWGKHTAATTSLDDAGDDILLFLFPGSPYTAYLPNSPSGLVVQMADLDTGSAAIKSDYGLGDDDGVIDTVLINDTTIAQAGGADQLDANLDLSPWITATGLYLIHTIVTAAATAAAGDISFGGVYASGLLELTG